MAESDGDGILSAIDDETRERVRSIEADLDARSERAASQEQEQAADPPKLPTRASEGEWQDVGLEIEEAKPNFFGRFGRRGSGNRGTVASQPATIPAAPEADVPLADVELGGGSTTQRNSVPPELPSAAPAASAAAEAGRISQREAPPSSKAKQQDAGSSADPPPNKPAGGVWSKAAAAAKGLKREIQIAKAAALVTVEQVKEAEKQEEKPRKKEPKPLASPPSMDSSDFIALGLPAPSQVDVVSTVTSSSRLSRQISVSDNPLAFVTRTGGSLVKTMSRSRQVSRIRGSSMLVNRSATAAEGIAILKQGATAIKYSKRGKSRPAKFTLAEDEAKLTWEGRKRSAASAAASYCGGKKRAVLICDVLDMAIGNQSEVFKKHMHKAALEKKTITNPHLSLSLILKGALPPRPDEIDDAADLEEVMEGGKERHTLDISFDDEEAFGMWVSALRQLLSEGQQRPAEYAKPFNPMHASAGTALALAAPKDATLYERFRDASLRGLYDYMQTRIFLVLTTIWVVNVVVWGCLYFFLIIGAHGFPVETNSTLPNYGKSEEANMWANISIQVLTALFSYITLFTLPWRVGNAVHLWCSRRSSAAGLDFYGRPTKGIWFHIHPRHRKIVVVLLNMNWVMQYSTQATRFIWDDFDASQTMPGALWINLTFVLGILFGISSGIAQGKFEEIVRKEKPGEFPDAPMTVFLKVWKEERRKAFEARENAKKDAQQQQQQPARPGSVPNDGFSPIQPMAVVMEGDEDGDPGDSFSHPNVIRSQSTAEDGLGTTVEEGSPSDASDSPSRQSIKMSDNV